MLTPDINPIKPSPRKDTDYSSLSSNSISSTDRTPPNVRKDFKKILEEDGSQKKANTQNRTSNAPVAKEKKPSKNVYANPLLTNADDQIDRDEVSDANDYFEPSEEIAYEDEKTLHPFELAKSKKDIPLPTGSPTALADNKKSTNTPKSPTTPMSVYRQMSTDKSQDVADTIVEQEKIKKEYQKPFAIETMSQNDGDLPLPYVKEKSNEKKEKNTARTEDSTLATVNLMANASTVASIDQSKGTIRAEVPKNLKEVFDNLVDRLYTMESSGQTQTVVEIKNIPMFEGSQIVVTGFETAAKEFNISFENLSQAAKQVLDLNMASLRTHLEQAGFVNAVHIITTTTQIENRPFGENPSFAREDNSEDRQDQRNREQRKQG